MLVVMWKRINSFQKKMLHSGFQATNYHRCEWSHVKYIIILMAHYLPINAQENTPEETSWSRYNKYLGNKQYYDLKAMLQLCIFSSYTMMGFVMATVSMLQVFSHIYAFTLSSHLHPSLLLAFFFSKIPFSILMPYRYKDGAKMIDARQMDGQIDRLLIE